MYNEFYGFQTFPFSITPDPNFIYMSAGHRQALSQMLYGVQEHKYLTIVTGEVGSGKTTMIFTLLSQLKEDTRVCIIFDTHVDSKSLYRYLFADLQIPYKPADRADATLALREYLIEGLEQDKKTLLILDEAHNLGQEIFHEIVFLTNLETARGKLLQIILVGQPELHQVLGTHEFRQLRQRVSFRTDIRPLDSSDTRAYILHRLTEAGRKEPESLFTDDAILLVYKHSKGLPRLINTLCDNSLLLGCARRREIIEKDLIQESYTDLMEIGESQAAPPPPPLETREPLPASAVDPSGHRIMREEVLDDREIGEERVRVLRRVVRLSDGREVVKQIRQVRRTKRPGGGISRRPARRTLPALPTDIPTRRLGPSAEEEFLPAFKHNHPSAVRQYHMLWDRIDGFARTTEPVNSFIVTSALPQEGKSVTAINLAATMAQAPQVRVLLVDADLHKPSIHDYLGMDMPKKGLTDILQGSASFRECLVNYELDRLFFIAAGARSGMPTELLVGEAMERFLGEVRHHFHFIVFDSPPIIPIVDTVGFAGMVDGVVLVTRARETSRTVVMQALDDLEGKRVLGMVLNGMDFRAAGRRYQYGYSRYGYGYGA